MQTVATNALRLLDAMPDHPEDAERLEAAAPDAARAQRLRCMVIAAAQLHDVLDHKYVEQGDGSGGAAVALAKDLRAHFSQKDAALLIQSMDAVSFSKERNLRVATQAPVSFEHILGTTGALVRDIVSDADKLEALGEIGVVRCMEFITERRLAVTKSAFHPNGIAPTPEEVVKALVAHGEEKLFIMLPHGYVRTEAGRQAAKPRHAAMMRRVFEMLRGTDEGADEVARLQAAYSGGVSMIEGVAGETQVAGESETTMAAGASLHAEVTHAPTVTRKDMRAWCRDEYGSNWWKVETAVKKQRLREAQQALEAPGAQRAGATPIGGGSVSVVTRKEMRAWCRQEFGPSWWEVAPELKKERLQEARHALTSA